MTTFSDETGATHMRRPEYLTAWLYTGQRSDEWPEWFAAKFAPGKPDGKIGHYATATDGEFWRWFDPEKFSELFVETAALSASPVAQEPVADTTRARMHADRIRWLLKNDPDGLAFALEMHREARSIMETLDELIATPPAIPAGVGAKEIARALWLKRPDCQGKPWPFDVMTEKERRAYSHNPIAAVDLCFIYAEAVLALPSRAEDKP